jgi:hypothetical protein
MPYAPIATKAQLARAAAIGESLTRSGWTCRREPNDTHPGAIAATAHTRQGMRALILTLGDRHGQMIEITAEATTEQRGERGRQVRDRKPSWRLTAYNPPTQAILAATTAAFDGTPDPTPLETAGWTIRQDPARKAARTSLRMVRATWFTRPDGAVTASFHIPTYRPPCEHCAHHGELGDTGGWYITGPGSTAEATAHTPAAVIGAFALALPDSGPHHQAATPEPPAVTSRRSTKSTPAAAIMPGARLTAVVC